MVPRPRHRRHSWGGVCQWDERRPTSVGRPTQRRPVDTSEEPGLVSANSLSGGVPCLSSPPSKVSTPEGSLPLSHKTDTRHNLRTTRSLICTVSTDPEVVFTREQAQEPLRAKSRPKYRAGHDRLHHRWPAYMEKFNIFYFTLILNVRNKRVIDHDVQPPRPKLTPLVYGDWRTTRHRTDTQCPTGGERTDH